MVSVTAADASTPPSPIRASIGMQSPPVVHAANLVSPAVVDVSHAPTVDVCPRRPTVDHIVFANVDLSDVHIAIQSIPVSNGWAIPDSVPDARPIFVTNSGAIDDAVS